ncbi:hypothetical protein A3C59_02705 [Candidatus Daviesbacteria bacterium RIFCSPHIGHO2_02_FULL_36_13]|uniref:Uncharacterized protein n=1 Tax=Candidatus Daviesbacteria bacterium RIFCSPHIGHO2_02_FULL_36_13 TaxID=1797768 RepID=A0A1F5JWF7_9BACT|nr:MAG: hypothetical protein A3C59_02705 [Candidatus Daviesbacteria bacterium RIFCSPHIGHO2_02_FULL_36_13]
MQKGFAHLGLLLIGIIIILGGGYLYLNQSSGIKNVTTPIVTIISSVHTYSNNSLGFEFQYSKDLKVLEDSEEEFNQRVAGGTVKAVADLRKNFKGYVFYEPGKFLGAAVVLEKEENYDASPFTVWVFDNPDNLSIGSWDKKYWYYPFVWGDFTQRRNAVAPVTEATISGQLAKFGIVDYQPGKPKFVYISKSGKMYMLRVIGDEGEKVLQTFKFI